jgi:hypothetical protein
MRVCFLTSWRRGDEGAQVTYRLRRHPDLRDQIGGQQTCQADGVVVVGLDRGGSDPFDLQGIGNQAAADQRSQLIVGVPSVAGGLEDDGILGGQVGLRSPTRSVLPVRSRHSSRWRGRIAQSVPNRNYILTTTAFARLPTVRFINHTLPANKP